MEYTHGGVVTFEHKGEAVFLVHVLPLHDTVMDGKGLIVVVEFHGSFAALVRQRGEGKET